MRRLRMTVPLGETEWRAQDEKNGQMVELPLAIELKAFTIDEYPPKLMLIDNSSGKLLPEKAPVHLLLEEGVSGGRLMDWNIAVAESLLEAASHRDGGQPEVHRIPFAGFRLCRAHQSHKQHKRGTKGRLGELRQFHVSVQGIEARRTDERRDAGPRTTPLRFRGHSIY